MFAAESDPVVVEYPKGQGIASVCVRPGPAS